MNKLSSVYLLMLKDKPYFKIGKSDNTVARLEVLEKMWGEFNLEKSIEIKCSTDRVFRLEKILQYIFEIYNVTMEEKHEGHTEWFDIECLDSVISMVQMIKQERNDILEIIYGVKVPKKKTKAIFSKLSAKEKRKAKAKMIRKKDMEVSNTIMQFLQENNTSISYINIKLGLIQFTGLDKKLIDQLWNYRFYNFTFFTTWSYTSDITWFQFWEVTDMINDDMEIVLLDVYKLLNELEQQPKINSDIAYGNNYLEEYKKELEDMFSMKEKIIEEKVTFKIFKFNKLGLRKYESITLNVNSINMVSCGGCGCTIYYKNGRRKTILWLDYGVLEDMKNDSSIDIGEYLWFKECESEEYQKFWKWKQQFPFDEIYMENPNLYN